MKKGSPFKYMLTGGRKMHPFGNPVPVGLTAHDYAKDKLRKIGFRIGGGDR